MPCNCCGKYSEDVMISLRAKVQPVGILVSDWTMYSLTGILCADCYSKMVKKFLATFQLINGR